jgi:hypothetical protein
VKAEIKNKAWLRRQIAAAADAELLTNSRLSKFVNPEFTQCSHAIKLLADTRGGQCLSLPSACLPPLH